MFRLHQKSWRTLNLQQRTSFISTIFLSLRCYFSNRKEVNTLWWAYMFLVQHQFKKKINKLQIVSLVALWSKNFYVLKTKFYWAQQNLWPYFMYLIVSWMKFNEEWFMFEYSENEKNRKWTGSFIYLKTDKWKGNEDNSVTTFAAHHFGIIICIIWLIEPKEKGNFFHRLHSHSGDTVCIAGHMELWS